MLTKDFSASVLDVDVNSRRVKACWSKMDAVDLGDDVIVKGAFKSTISQRGPKGKNAIWSLTDHNPTLKMAIGKPSELYEENDMLVAVTDIVETSWGNDVLEMYKTGLITEHSIGFFIPKNKYEIIDGKRYIKEVMLLEGSAVCWGMNPDTPTLSVGKSFFKDGETSEQKLQRLLDACKSGNFTDVIFAMIEEEVKNLKEEIANSSQPVQPTVDPMKAQIDIKTLLSHFKLS